MEKMFSSLTLRILAQAARKEHPQWRWGQAVWNVAVHYWPKQVEQFRATELDPFHNDDRVSEFISALQKLDWTT